MIDRGIHEHEPLFDIVMLVHDAANWADLAIRAVEHNTKNKFRLIIVDMASQEQKTKDLFARCKDEGHTVIHLAENRSFSNGVNAGIRAGDAKYIVILNDDAMVTEGWDTALLQDASDKSVGLVGARSNYVAGAQGDPSFIGDPPYLAFVCVALRRETYNAVGPLDEETFDGFSSEDLDYSWRVLKYGSKLKVSSAYVLHAGSRTLMNKLGANPDALNRNNAKYNERLIAKHGRDWVDSHSRIQPKILVCSFHAEEHTRVGFLARLVMLKASGGLGHSYHQFTRMHIQVARTMAFNLAADEGYDILLMLDDDATFPPDTLRRLYSHMNKVIAGKPVEIVTALAFQRLVPYGPCIFETDAEGKGRMLEGYERTGLRQVDASGMHCAMIKTTVIKKLREAGTLNYFGGFENKFGEDIAFSANLKKLGIPMYCDTDFVAGHIGSNIVVDEAFRNDWVARGRPGLG
jgi:GT2 family glycosyltransferase